MTTQRTSNQVGNMRKTRILYPDGRIVEYEDSALALQVFYGLPKGVKAAFRAAGDETCVYPHDFVDS